MLTGIRSVSFFAFSGLTFARVRGIDTIHPFGNRCRTCSNFAGGFAHVSTGFLRFELGNRKKAVFEEELAKVHKFPSQTAAKHIKG